MSAPESVIAALQRSGFPFQTAVAQAIQSLKGWSIYATEYSWLTATKEAQFLDLVANKDRFLLAIECKKTRKEVLTFLRPEGYSHTGKLTAFRCLYGEQIQDATRRLELYCAEWALHPISTCSEFCVVSTSESGKDQRLLERDASLVVRATEAFAHDFRQQSQPGSQFPIPCLFIPVIVTNAPIYTARYRPTEVSLKTGEFQAPPQDIQTAPCVRFQKAFASDGRTDLGHRTVFIVNAEALTEFLDLIDTAPQQPTETAWGIARPMAWTGAPRL